MGIQPFNPIVILILTPDNRAQESSDYKTDYSPLDRNLNGPQKSTAVRRLANCRSHFLALLPKRALKLLAGDTSFCRRIPSPDYKALNASKFGALNNALWYGMH